MGFGSRLEDLGVGEDGEKTAGGFEISWLKRVSLVDPSHASRLYMYLSIHIPTCRLYCI